MRPQAGSKADRQDPETDARSLLASSVLTLTQVALAAPDLPSGITPTLQHLVNHTAAVGAAYFQASDLHASGFEQAQPLVYQVRAASGAMPDTPGMAQVAAHGLPAEMPLMRALSGSAGAVFFDDVRASPDTQEFLALGVCSVAAAPVRMASGQLIGAFLMHTFEQHTWNASEAALFSMVSGTIAALAGRLAAEEQLRAAHESALQALGMALEARDGETQGHTSRVTALAMAMASELGLTAAQVRSLRWGAYLHDIGKIAIPDAVLLKPARLTPEEWVIMQSHVQAGITFASALSFLSANSMCVIAEHHERWDGSGYPRGLAGKAISIEARIFALCDVYDALTSLRPYKPAWSREDALAEIQAQAGRHFDPGLVSLFVNVVCQIDHNAGNNPNAGNDLKTGNTAARSD